MSSTVTNVSIRKTENGNTLAYADITLNEDFVVKGLRVVKGENGNFVAMPQGKKYQKDGKDVYPDSAFPVTKELREAINKAVLDKYDET